MVRSPDPTFIIVGAMRSGTTSLARWLGDHPQMFMAASKEVHYFDRYYELGSQWYLKHFVGSDNFLAVGEATPNYMYRPVAVQRLANDLPDVQLIVLLRDPIARAFSHYQHRVARGGEDLSFAEAIAAEPRRLASADDTVRDHFSYVDRGRYLHQLQRIMELVPRERLYIELFENLTREPVSVFRSITSWLGADPSTIPPSVGRALNSHQNFRSHTLRRAARHLPGAARRALGRLNRIQGGYPPVPRADVAQLLEVFLPERQALQELTGRDLSVWTHDLPRS